MVEWTEQLRDAMSGGNLKDAAGVLEDALRRDSNNPALHYNYSVVLIGLGRADESEAYLRQAIKLNPGFAEAHVSLANRLSAKGDTAAAAVSYKQALQHNPASVDAINNFAAMLFRIGDYQEAADYFLKAAALAPGDPVVRQNLGSCFEKRGDLDKAQDAYEQAFTLNPSYKAATRLMEWYRRSGRGAMSGAFYDRCLATSSINDQHMLYLGFVLIWNDQPEKALAAMDRWAAAWPVAYVVNAVPPAASLTTSFTAETPSPRFQALIDQYQQLHRTARTQDDDTFEGALSFTIVGAYVRDFLRAVGAKTLLDYGGGRGAQYKMGVIELGGRRYRDSLDYLGISDVKVFDPGAEDALAHETFDAVICIDVLEHIDRQDAPWVVKQLFEKARRGVFANIAAYPATKTLPNGENAHCTIETPEWWMEIFAAAAASYPSVDYRVIVTTDMMQKRRAAFRR